MCSYCLILCSHFTTMFLIADVYHLQLYGILFIIFFYSASFFRLTRALRKGKRAKWRLPLKCQRMKQFSCSSMRIEHTKHQQLRTCSNMSRHEMSQSCFVLDKRILSLLKAKCFFLPFSTLWSFFFSSTMFLFLFFAPCC